MTRRDLAQQLTVLVALLVLVLAMGLAGWVQTGGAW